jgi:hypothetical protein
MAIDHSSSDGPCVAATEKKPYEKPRFRYEQVFVTSAISCSKAADQEQCMTTFPTKVS